VRGPEQAPVNRLRRLRGDYTATCVGERETRMKPRCTGVKPGGAQQQRACGRQPSFEPVKRIRAQASRGVAWFREDGAEVGAEGQAEQHVPDTPGG
jgi:hypothetical protein